MTNLQCLMPVAAISETVSEIFDVPVNVLLSHRRMTDACFARFAVIGLALEFSDKSQVQIGLALGRRDHSTISYGRDRFELLMGTDEGFATRVGLARAALHIIARDHAGRRVWNIDAAACAHRVIANPERGPVSVSALEIRAMALRLLELENALSQQPAAPEVQS